MSPRVIQIRRDLCEAYGCNHTDVNYLDPCAQCPNGRWGVYDSDCAIEPEENKTLILNPKPKQLGISNKGGPGTELKKLISRIGIKAAPGCKCGAHVQEMDIKGPDWCRDNIETIIGWLEEEAGRAKLPFSKIGARILIRRAISISRKKSKL